MMIAETHLDHVHSHSLTNSLVIQMAERGGSRSPSIGGARANERIDDWWMALRPVD